MPDLLVTGTDTGVGKTVIAAALVSALRSRGVRALGFKPVETGIDDAFESDAQILSRASNETSELAAPLLSLREPLAPAVAAERAGVELSAEAIELRIAELRHAGYQLVIEGAGGVMVPLVWGYTALDLAERLRLEAVVVARAGLGTLNHAVMTVAMLQGRDVPIRGVVLNRRRPVPDLAERTNPAALARLLPGMRIVEVPHEGADPVAQAAALLNRLL